MLHSKVTDFGKEIHCVIALVLINVVDYWLLSSQHFLVFHSKSPYILNRNRA